jgi:hypothetical protein
VEACWPVAGDGERGILALLAALWEAIDRCPANRSAKS